MTFKPGGLYEFNAMHFGLCNGPATFQRLMNLLFVGIQWSSCLVHLDDLIVVGISLEDHLRYYVMSPDGVATDPSKIEKVVNWPVPTNKSEVQQFLGFVNYYRRFIRDCAQIAMPLNQ